MTCVFSCGTIAALGIHVCALEFDMQHYNWADICHMFSLSVYHPADL